jgi:hypothetical protein
MIRTLSVEEDENSAMNEKNSKRAARRKLSDEGEKHEEMRDKKSQLGTRRSDE